MKRSASSPKRVSIGQSTPNCTSPRDRQRRSDSFRTTCWDWLAVRLSAFTCSLRCGLCEILVRSAELERDFRLIDCPGIIDLAALQSSIAFSASSAIVAHSLSGSARESAQRSRQQQTLSKLRPKDRPSSASFIPPLPNIASHVKEARAIGLESRKVSRATTQLALARTKEVMVRVSSTLCWDSADDVASSVGSEGRDYGYAASVRNITPSSFCTHPFSLYRLR